MQCMRNVQSTKFLHKLLTTTPSTSHVSDFRGQRKTDSRADKPDTFPGFDLHEDGTTVSPHKRRRQAYSKLIQLFIANTKNRLETIRDVIKDDNELHIRLTQPFNEAETSDSSKNDKIHFLEEVNDETNRQFIDTAYGDANQVANNEINATQTYLNSLYAAIGYSRITKTATTSTTLAPITMQQDNLVTRYVLNPLFRIWYSALPMSDVASTKYPADADQARYRTTHKYQPPFKVNNSSIVDMDLVSNTKFDRLMDKKVNDSYADGFNYRLPVVRQSSNDENATITMASADKAVDIMSNVNRSRSQHKMNRTNVGDAKQLLLSASSLPMTSPPPSTAIRNAATAFRNAFYKYSNYTKRPVEHTEHNVSHTAVSSVNEKFSDTKSEQSSDLLDARIILGNIANAKPGHVQTIPAKQHRTQENDGADEYFDDANVDSAKEANTFGMNASVLVFEMIGTVAGMTWQALAQLPNYWQR